MWHYHPQSSEKIEKTSGILIKLPEFSESMRFPQPNVLPLAVHAIWSTPFGTHKPTLLNGHRETHDPYGQTPYWYFFHLSWNDTILQSASSPSLYFPLTPQLWLLHVEPPRPGIKPAHQPWPKPLQWQNQLLTPLCHNGNSYKSLMHYAKVYFQQVKEFFPDLVSVNLPPHNLELGTWIFWMRHTRTHTHKCPGASGHRLLSSAPHHQHSS